MKASGKQIQVSLEPNIKRLIAIFDRLFAKTENTRLQMGASEPFYQAARGQTVALIHFREDFFSSALHEIAHWCIAGEHRRQQDDYGYWYQADGRTMQQQIEFESVEVKPQAIECLFSLACNHKFHLSADNFSYANQASEAFKRQVFMQVASYQKNGLPARAQILFDQLIQTYRAGQPPELGNV